MEDRNIIRHRKGYRHLTHDEVIMIVERVKALEKSDGPLVSGKRAIAEEAGVRLDTVYRIERDSLVELKRFDRRQCRYLTDHFELSAAAAAHVRDVKSARCHQNARKLEKAAPFLRAVFGYIMADRRIRTIDEAVGLTRKEWKGETVTTRTAYDYAEKGLIMGYSAKDMPRRPRWKAAKKYKQYTARDCRGRSILERPASINERREFGHWEGDLVVGPKDGIRGAYITLLERVTRFYVMIKIPDRRSDTVLRAMCSYKDMVGKDRFGSVFKSVTFDNGIEFSKWREMEQELGTVTYFGRPYHSCDRGSNENCNGLIRRYIRKGTDINEVSSSETRRINMAINGKHRRILGYESAADSFRSMLLKEGIPDIGMYL